MRALYLRTTTPSNENVLASFLSLWPDAEILFTDNPDVELVETAEVMRPDVIIYIGAIDAGTHRKIPHIDELCALGRIAPMVHLCFDACDWAWHPFLERYNDAGCFALQVAIDGSFETPIARWKKGMVWITPIDPSVYRPQPYRTRTTLCGFAGGYSRGHPGRAELIERLEAARLLTRLAGYPTVPYGELAAFYCNCQSVPNSPSTGSGKRDHVKGRVLECAWAGAVLLERRGSPTHRWFDRKTMYLEYESEAEAAAKIVWVMRHPERAEQMAHRMHHHAHQIYTPAHFWHGVLKRAGVDA